VEGKITRLSVTYSTETDDGQRHAFYELETLRRHARPERFQELLDDLAVMCADVQAASERTPVRERS
jgi:hypothetical protein